MNTREQIEEEMEAAAGETGMYINVKLQTLLLLDIRELLIKQEETELQVTDGPN